MSVHILFDHRYPMRTHEKDGAQIFFVGTLHGNDNPLETIERLFLSGGALAASESASHYLRSLSGSFCLVIQDRKRQILAATDKIRSYPLFYSLKDNTVIVGNDCQHIKSMIQSEKNALSFLEFQMTGYVTGQQTLFQDISQLQAGEVLLYDGRNIQVKQYYLFHTTGVFNLSEEALIERLHDVTTSIFNRLIQRLNGRPVLIPLSAGNDSRLVVCMLKHLGYHNVRTFTFGIPGNHEARWAREIRRRIGVPWLFVPYTRRSGKQCFRSPLYATYSQFIPSIVTIPFILDFPALCSLFKSQRIPTNAVLINGLSGDFISGSHEHPDIFGTSFIKKEDLLNYIINRHYSLWLHLLTPENTKQIRKKIEEVIPLPLPDLIDQTYAVKWYELWEWACRQTKYVLNSQRAYDFFGLSWELPLWDDAYLEFWSRIPAAYKLEQRLYRDYLRTYNFFGVFRDVQFDRYLSPPFIRHLHRLFAVFGAPGIRYAKIFLSYWQGDSYYYALYPYREYLRYASLHRNAISYHVKYVLEHEYNETIATVS